MTATPFTRRRLFQLSAGGLLAAGVWPTRSDAAHDPFRFVQVNDLHSFDAKCLPWFEKVTAKIREQKPEFVLVVGDLANDGSEKQLGGLKDALNTLGVPFHAVPGNHDYTAKSDRKSYDALFPNKLNYAFTHAGWQFVGVDSTEGILHENVKVGKPALAWLDAELPKLDAAKPTVLFTHFPVGKGVKMRLANADAVLDRFKPLALKGVFGGHYHSFTETKLPTGIVATTNKCCAVSKGNHDGTTERGFFTVDVKDGEIRRTFTQVVL